MLDKDIDQVLISSTEIDAIVLNLRDKITQDYHDKFPIVLGLLKGCIPFMTNLITKLDFHLELEFMNVSSYHGSTSSSGEVRIVMDLDTPVKDRHVLITEDIVDSGRTINTIIDLLKHRGAKSVKVVTLMDKPAGRVIDLSPDYIGTTIPKAFVVGYGLDYQEKYRNLPYVGILKPEIYLNKE